MSTGSVKVMLLLLGIISFATVWSNDQRPVAPERMVALHVVEPSRSLDREYAANQIELKVVEFPRTDQASLMSSQEWLSFPAALPSTFSVPSKQSVKNSDWVLLEKLEYVKIDGIEHPLPQAIAPGEYRVIDRFGNVSTQSVPLETALATGFEVGTDARDSYLARENEDRWHFIRIERDLIAERNESNLRADVRQAWRSVLRVIAEQTERPLQDLRRPIENWLAPQDIAETHSTVRR
jgi:hypothetical protein